ncbi:MAG: hypothetical protein ACOVNY_02200 [Chitinophagaceae bacterium]
MRFLFLILSFFVLQQTQAQCKSYRLNAQGDTLNCIDKNGKKQGKWVIRVESLRGEPGFEEEGVFKNDGKEGIWRVYNLMGDLVAIESYKWGYKDGTSQYFTLAGLEHEESWKAVNPEKPYDTIDVPDVYDHYKIERKLVKIEGTTVKHGIWKYYRPGSLSLLKTETYFLDKLQIPRIDPTIANTNAMNDEGKKETVEKQKPKEVQEFEKKTSGKKAVKVRDGRVGF